jgi:excinuclease ABC subunit A
LKTPIEDIPEEALDKILFGTSERIQLKNSPLGAGVNYFMSYEGIVKYMLKVRKKTIHHKKPKNGPESIYSEITCPECNGQRLKKESLWFKIDGKNISEVAQMDLIELGNG